MSFVKKGKERFCNRFSCRRISSFLTMKLRCCLAQRVDLFIFLYGLGFLTCHGLTCVTANRRKPYEIACSQASDRALNRGLAADTPTQVNCEPSGHALIRRMAHLPERLRMDDFGEFLSPRCPATSTQGFLRLGVRRGVGPVPNRRKATQALRPLRHTPGRRWSENRTGR